MSNVARTHYAPTVYTVDDDGMPTWYAMDVPDQYDRESYADEQHEPENMG